MWQRCCQAETHNGLIKKWLSAKYLSFHLSSQGQFWVKSYYSQQEKVQLKSPTVPSHAKETPEVFDTGETYSFQSLQVNFRVFLGNPYTRTVPQKERSSLSTLCSPPLRFLLHSIITYLLRVGAGELWNSRVVTPNSSDGLACKPAMWPHQPTFTPGNQLSKAPIN